MKRMNIPMKFAIAFALTIGLLGWLGFTSTAYAAPAMQEVTPIPGADGQLIDPSVEQRLSQQPFAIGPGEQQWFTFRHEGGGHPVQIWMDPEPNEGAGFRIFTEDVAGQIMQGADPEQFTPVGAGTPNPDEPGWLFWRGTMENPGRFFVLIDHHWPEPVRYDIFAFGPGLTAPTSEEQSPQSVAAGEMDEGAPVQQIEAQDDAGGIRTLPGEVISLANPPVGQRLAQNQFVIGPGEIDWFIFKHDGGGQPMHIWMDPEPDEGAGFKIYTQEVGEQIMRGADRKQFTPIGAGTPNPDESGWLFWRGAMENPGRFYVVVEQGWADPVEYGIFAAGPGFVPVAPQ